MKTELKHMKRKIGMRALSMLLAVMLVSVGVVPAMAASKEKSREANIIGIDVPAPEQIDIPLDDELALLTEHDDGVIIDCTEIYLNYWNEKLNWGISEEEIKEYSQILEKQVLVRYYDADDHYYHITDLDTFGEELGSVLGLNGDGRTTDDMARSLKNWSGANTVILLYLTHDDMGGYAVGPDQGYADKGALSYWGRADWGRFPSVPESYEHESLHLYGALDEYAGVSSCGQSSILVVSPMHEMYTNTNHISCPSSTNSVMRDPYTTSTISLSSRRFIGWGDYDNDGILDPLDGTPWG